MTRSHYLLHLLALELADQYGIVVWDEVPVYQMADSLFRRGPCGATASTWCARW